MQHAKPQTRLYVRALLLLIAYVGLLGGGLAHALEHWELNPATHIHSSDGKTTCPEDEHIPACSLCHADTLNTYSSPEVYHLEPAPRAERRLTAVFLCLQLSEAHALYQLRGPPALG